MVVPVSQPLLQCATPVEQRIGGDLAELAREFDVVAQALGGDAQRVNGRHVPVGFRARTDLAPPRPCFIRPRLNEGVKAVRGSRGQQFAEHDLQSAREALQVLAKQLATRTDALFEAPLFEEVVNEVPGGTPPRAARLTAALRGHRQGDVAIAPRPQGASDAP